MAAERLFACYPQHTPNRPKEYMAAVVSLLAEYPHEVVNIVCDPRRGIATRCKFLPTIAELSEALKEEMKPHHEQWIAEHKRRRELPAPRYENPTPEQHKRVETILEGLKDLGSKDPLEELRAEAREKARASMTTQIADSEGK